MRKEIPVRGKDGLTEAETEVLLRSRLFEGIRKEELSVLLPCLKARKALYRKGELVFRMGEKSHDAGLVLSGSLHSQWYSYDGKRHIVSAFLPGDIVGVNYAAAGDEVPNVDLESEEETRLLLLDFASLLSPCAKSCPFHSRLIDNLVLLLARWNIALKEKLTVVLQPTLKDKILSYLAMESYRQHSRSFEIPFDRQQLADFLNAERSALSHELSLLRKEGLIDFEKNRFRLLWAGNPEKLG